MCTQHPHCVTSSTVLHAVHTTDPLQTNPCLVSQGIDLLNKRPDVLLQGFRSSSAEYAEKNCHYL